MTENNRPLAIVTGASNGIGYELAKCCAKNGFDLVVASGEPAIYDAACDILALGVEVEAVEADLSTLEGVDKLYFATRWRPVDALITNSGQGLGHAFLDQNFDDVQRVIDTDITGTIYLIQEVGRDMRSRGFGRILIAGPIVGFVPGSYQAVYNGIKAFLDSFSFAFRAELKDTGVTVTCMIPDTTETNLFERAGMLDTNVGQQKKVDPAELAMTGFDAMMRGEGDVVTGWQIKLQSEIALLTPSNLLAAQPNLRAKSNSQGQNDR
jgi:short-subunit dehydrogenase